MAVAEGAISAAIWFVGDIWDHAAPSQIVEEAEGRFTDHSGGHSRETHTAVDSNGVLHEETLEILTKVR